MLQIQQYMNYSACWKEYIVCKVLTKCCASAGTSWNDVIKCTIAKQKIHTDHIESVSYKLSIWRPSSTIYSGLFVISDVLRESQLNRSTFTYILKIIYPVHVIPSPLVTNTMFGK